MPAVWRLLSIDAGKGGRATDEYFIPTSDWTKAYSWQEPHGTYTSIERDGKQLTNVEYGSVIHAWNLETGSLLHTYQTKPADGVRSIELSPDGTYILSLDETPGVFESQRPRALTLWNTKTGRVPARRSRKLRAGMCFVR